MLSKNKEYISLKEASEISGYSADYIGQLIRAGKLPGKQVFQQVVWMTTEADLLAYMEKKKGTPESAETQSRFERILRYFRDVELTQLMMPLLYAAAGFSVCLFLFLFYIFSSSLDHRLDQHAIEQLEAKSSL